MKLFIREHRLLIGLQLVQSVLVCFILWLDGSGDMLTVFYSIFLSLFYSVVISYTAMSHGADFTKGLRNH